MNTLDFPQSVTACKMLILFFPVSIKRQQQNPRKITIYAKSVQIPRSDMPWGLRLDNELHVLTLYLLQNLTTPSMNVILLTFTYNLVNFTNGFYPEHSMKFFGEYYPNNLTRKDHNQNFLTGTCKVTNSQSPDNSSSCCHC